MNGAIRYGTTDGRFSGVAVIDNITHMDEAADGYVWIYFNDGTSVRSSTAIDTPQKRIYEAVVEIARACQFTILEME